MDDSQSTTATVHHGSPIGSRLDLSSLPPVFVLASHLSSTEQHDAEDVLSNGGAPLTYDIKEASLVLGNIARPKRAKLELQWSGLIFLDETGGKESDGNECTPAKKRRIVKHKGSRKAAVPAIVHSDSDVNSDTAGDESASQLGSQPSISQSSSNHASDRPPLVEESSFLPIGLDVFEDRMVVARLAWLHHSAKAGTCLPLEPYVLYKTYLDRHEDSAAKTYIPKEGCVSILEESSSGKRRRLDNGHGVIERAKRDEKPVKRVFGRKDRFKEAAAKEFAGRSFSSFGTRPPHLLHQTTSENEEELHVVVPPMPEWVSQNKVYSCERATPLNSPNTVFISQLKQIKLARLLALDEIGVRAYSTSIASLAAYPHPLRSIQEILALPGCDQKIAHLFHEYQTSNGQIQAVIDFEADPAMKILREFYEIWGVGAHTARQFYFEKGWRDLDDVVEYGWKTISRVQQIGLKYYDEFQLKISRAEVESIAATIKAHAEKITDSGIEAIIVGGYRRGKPESGDVDVILSHRNQDMTHNLVPQVVKSLEKDNCITHCLTLNLTNTKRNQEALPLRTGTIGGHGFDTLDKALVVWQDPTWPTRTADLARNPKAKNPNPHRRVDIIISPWRTVGCAVAGWTSGTTFQRDLRRYCKNVKGWKFDSSGVRDRGTGQWVDLEGWSNEKTRCEDWNEAERRVFAGLGLVYREPWDRCTG